MVKALLLVGWITQTALASDGKSCAFRSGEQETKLLERIGSSIAEFKKNCAPTAGSEFDKNLNDMLANAQQLASGMPKDTPIGDLGNWLGMPITCSNYPQFLSAQREDAVRKILGKLQPCSTDAKYSACSSQPNPIECADRVREDKIDFAANHCRTSRNESIKTERAKFLSHSYEALNKNLGVLLSTMNKECMQENSEAFQASALKTASALASTYAAMEPVAGAASMGIAMAGSALNQVVTHLFKAQDPSALIQKEKIFPELSCLFLETMELDLNCAQLLKPAEPTKPKTELTQRESLFANGDGKGSPVDAVLRAMNNVDDLASGAAKNEGGKPTGNVELSPRPVLDELTAVMNMPVLDPAAGSGNYIPMKAYLARVAQDLQFAGRQTRPGPVSEEAVRKHLGERAAVAKPMQASLSKRGPEYRRATGTLGETLGQLLGPYMAYESALEAQDRDAIATKRKELLDALHHISSTSLEDVDGVLPAATLVRQAIDRHLDLVLSESSGLRALGKWELASQIDKQIKDSLPQGARPAVADSFRILRNAYGKGLKKKVNQYARELTETLKDFKPERASTNVRENLFSKSVKPLLDQCTLLAGFYVFGDNTNLIDRGGKSDYENLCAPLMCADGSGIPSFDFKNSQPIAFREHQCQLIYDHEGISKRMQDRLVKEGTLCPPEEKKNLLQRGLEHIPKFPSFSKPKSH